MKKTYFITMITAALVGSAYANTDCNTDPGATQSNLPYYVYGTYADTGEASDGFVEVYEVITGGHEYLWFVFGGYVDEDGSATDNTVTMTGGNATRLHGGYVEGSGNASYNTVTMTGGNASYVFGGSTNSGDATNNTITTSDFGGDVYGGFTSSGAASYNAVNITGGTNYVENVYGGYSSSGDAIGNTINMYSVRVWLGSAPFNIKGGNTWSGNARGNTVNLYDCVCMFVHGGYASGEATGNTVNMIGGSARQVYGGSGDTSASNNTVRLIGQGAEYTIEGTTYQGSSITVDYGVHAGNGEGLGNSVHVHGTGINVGIETGGTIDSCQLLTFHLVDDQAGAPGTPMVTLGGALDLTSVELGFYGDAVTDWAAFKGKSITLVSMTNETITGLVVPSDPVDILDAGGAVLATASMMLSDDAQTLSLQFAGGQTSYTANPGSPQTSAPDSIFGAYSETGDVTGGSAGVFEVETGGYSSLGDVFGGYAVSGSVSGCTASMSGGKVNGDVRGGYAYSGNATGNAVDMTGGEVGYDVVGGYVDNSGDATGNTVTIAGGYVDVHVLGGHTYSGNATGNSLTMTGGQVGRDVYGGCVVDSGEATGNSLTMTGGQVGRDVYGGYTYSGEASGNSVTMDNGEITSMLFGGYSNNDGDASSNTVIVNGGYVHSDVCGGYAKSGSASNNTLTMAGRTDGDVYAGKAGNGSASGNSVNMSGGSAQTVAGGIAMKDNATGNTANMSGGSAHIVVGGYAEVGNADGNTAIMIGGEVGLLAGAEAIAGNATGNTAIMAGGLVTSDVYGGGASDGGNATDNTVHLVGEGASYTVGDTTYQGSKIAIRRSVHGVYVEAGGVSSNNSVHIHGTGASIGGTIDSCQRLNFHIVQGQAGAQGTPMVTLGGALNLDGVELGFNGDAVTNWAAFNGKSITLVSMTSETITGLLTPTDSVDITDEDGTVLGTATLTLADADRMLLLTNIQGVGPVPPPVPTVGPDALDVTLVNSLWASSAYVREFVRLSEAQGYALKAGDTAVWGGGFGTFMHTTGDKGFKSDGGGYGIGVNHAFSANTQGGLSFGQGFGSYHNSGADGAKVHQRAILAAATASTRIGKDFSLGGHLAFGNVRNRADCRLDGAPTERARWNDNVFNLGARAAYDFHVTERTAITPFLGLDWMNGAHESFGGAYGRHYSHGRLNELRMPVGVTVSTSAEVGSTKLLPQLSVAYVPSLAQQLPHADVSGENGNYRVKGYAPGRNAFMLNAGVNAVFSDSWSAGAFYTLETRRHCVDQSVNASVRYTF